jgi:hypothetical protein
MKMMLALWLLQVHSAEYFVSTPMVVMEPRHCRRWKAEEALSSVVEICAHPPWDGGQSAVEEAPYHVLA